jgi:hypothetical protein
MKESKNIYTSYYNKASYGEFYSYGALGDFAYCHSTPSPTTLIFIENSLLQHLFSICAFGEYSSGDVEKSGPISAPSPTIPIVTTCLLLRHPFSLNAFFYIGYFH